MVKIDHSRNHYGQNFRFLLVKGKEKEARKAVAFYHGNDEQDVDKTLIELKEEAKENSKALGMLGVCRDRLTLRGTIVGSMVGLLVGMTGIDGKFYIFI